MMVTVTDKNNVTVAKYDFDECKREYKLDDGEMNDYDVLDLMALFVKHDMKMTVLCERVR